MPPEDANRTGNGARGNGNFSADRCRNAQVVDGCRYRNGGAHTAKGIHSLDDVIDLPKRGCTLIDEVRHRRNMSTIDRREKRDTDGVIVDLRSCAIDVIGYRNEVLFLCCGDRVPVQGDARRADLDAVKFGRYGRGEGVRRGGGIYRGDRDLCDRRLCGVASSAKRIGIAGPRLRRMVDKRQTEFLRRAIAVHGCELDLNPTTHRLVVVALNGGFDLRLRANDGRFQTGPVGEDLGRFARLRRQLIGVCAHLPFELDNPIFKGSEN